MAGLNLFTNNAATTLASGLSAIATTLTVATGDGAEFPTLAGAQYFFCTIANNAGSTEIIKVTARSTDTFTIVRAQDGTTAAAWSFGDKVELRLTRIDLLNFPQLDSTNTFALAQTFTAAPVFTDQSGTRTAMLAAKSGANSDITSLTACTTITGLTTPLSVAQGGTGAATLTANNVILGNGTSAVAFVAPGTTGNLLTSNGTTWTSAAAPVSGFTTMQVFTSPGTFTTPSTTTKIKVTVVGGGASGGGGPANGNGGGGGGGAAIYVGPVTASTPYAVTVGASVAGSTNAVGTAGNTSSFGALASATGGGIGPSAGPSSGRGGAGGAGSAGTIQFVGGSGGSPSNLPTATFGGFGGSSFLAGITTSQVTAPGTVGNGNNYGGGGGGSGSNTVISGTGAAGVVIVEY